VASKTVRVYLAFSTVFAFFLSLQFSYYVVFLQKHGLSFTEAGMVNGFFMVMAFLFEIPTGVVADYFGRKTSVLIGVVVSAFGYLIYSASETLPGFLLAEGVFALGISFRSGALEAWVTDELDQAADTKRMTGVFSNGQIFARVATMAGGLIGGTIAVYDMHLPWLISGIGYFAVAIAFSFLMKEDFFKKNEHRTIKGAFLQMKKILVDSIDCGYRNKAVWNLILLDVMFIFGVQSFNMLWNPLFESKAGANWLGTGYLLMSAAVVAGCVLTSWLNKRISARTVMFAALGITAVGGAATFLSGSVLVIALFFLVHEFGRGLYMPVQQAQFQALIPKETRATVGSFSSMCSKLGAAFGWMGAGMAAESLEIPAVWAIWSLSFIACMYFVAKLRRQA
jgi:MFS family permease